MADEMVWPSTEERQILLTYFRMGARQREAGKLLSSFASRHGFSQVAAARSIVRYLGDFVHQMGIFDPTVPEDVQNCAREVLRHHRYEICFQILNSVPSARLVYTPAAGAGARSLFLLHHDYTAPVENRASVESRRCVLQDLGGSDSTARGETRTYHWIHTSSVGNHHSASSQLLGHNGREEFRDRSLHLTPTDHGFSWNISPGAHDMILKHTLATGDAGWNKRIPTFADNGGSSRILNWSAAANPNAGSGSGGSAGDHIFIDMHAFLLENSDLVEEELRETESENSWARRILETTIGTLLPAAVVNARDFFSDTPDVVKLAGNMILPALLAFCLIGMLHKRKAGSILRLATCAAIAAATLGVSSQLSDRIYAFIAVVAGVALSFTTLTA